MTPLQTVIMLLLIPAVPMAVIFGNMLLTKIMRKFRVRHVRRLCPYHAQHLKLKEMAYLVEGIGCEECKKDRDYVRKSA